MCARGVQASGLPLKLSLSTISSSLNKILNHKSRAAEVYNDDTVEEGEVSHTRFEEKLEGNMRLRNFDHHVFAFMVPTPPPPPPPHKQLLGISRIGHFSHVVAPCMRDDSCRNHRHHYCYVSWCPLCKCAFKDRQKD